MIVIVSGKNDLLVMSGQHPSSGSICHFFQPKESEVEEAIEEVSLHYLCSRRINHVCARAYLIAFPLQSRQQRTRTDDMFCSFHSCFWDCILRTLNGISVHIALPCVMMGSMSGSFPSQQSSSTQRHPASRTCAISRMTCVTVKCIVATNVTCALIIQ